MSETNFTASSIKDLEMQVAKARRDKAASVLALVEGALATAAVTALNAAAEVFKGEAFTAFMDALREEAAEVDADNPIFGTIDNLGRQLAACAEQGNVLSAAQAIANAGPFGKTALQALDRKISGTTPLPGRPAF